MGYEVKKLMKACDCMRKSHSSIDATDDKLVEIMNSQLIEKCMQSC